MARLKTLLAAALNVRPGEGLPLILLLVHSFADGISLVFLDTPASTLFLGRFSVESLPYVYVLTAIVSTTIGFAYSRLEPRVSRLRLLAGTLVVMFLATSGLYVALLMASSRWLVMGLMVWKEVAWVLSGIEFWALAGILFNVRQGKRLFALVGAGQVVSGILGGFSVPIIVSAIGTQGLLLLSAGGTVLSFGTLLYTAAIFRDRLAGPQDAREEVRARATEKESLAKFWKQRYLSSFFLVSILSGLAFYFIDYLFYDRVETSFPSQERLAVFFGIYYAVLNGVELASSVFLSGRLMTRYGLSFGLFAVPVVNVITGGGALVSAMLGAAALFVWAIVVGKLLDEVTRNSVQTHAFRILYQPLPAARRLRIQALRESVIEPIAIGLSGVVLLVLTSVLKFGPVPLLCIVLVILAAWISATLVLRREYTSTLVTAISRKRSSDLAISLDDASTVEALTKGLASGHTSQVIYCIHLLEMNEHPLLVPSLVQLLTHRETDVRRYALERIEDLRVSVAAEEIARTLAIEASPVVKAQALRTLCAIGEADAFEDVSSYLTDPDPIVRKGAMVGLLRSGGIDGVLAAGGDLNSLLISPVSAGRELAAQVLGDVGIRNFFRPLLALLGDDDVAVRRAALEAAGKLRNLKLLPRIIDALGQPLVRDQAFTAALQYGPDALPALERSFDDASRTVEFRAGLARLCGRIGGSRAVSLLRKWTSAPEQELRGAVLQALVHCRYRARGREVEAVVTFIRDETETVAWSLASLRDLASSRANVPVVSALREEIVKSQDRILKLLSFLFLTESVDEAVANLRAKSSEKRAAALEVLDNVLAKDVKAMVLPVVDELTPEARMARLTDFPQTRLGRSARLEEIARSGHRTSDWTKACALFEIGSLRETSGNELLVDSLTHAAPIVRETAAWALYQANRPLYRKHRESLFRDSHVIVHRTVERLDASLSGARPKDRAPGR